MSALAVQRHPRSSSRSFARGGVLSAAAAALLLVFAASMAPLSRCYEVPSDGDVLHSVGGEGVSGALDAARIRVLVWNIHKSSEEDWSKDFRLLSSSCDLILLQEFLESPETLPVYEGLSAKRWDVATSFVFEGTGAKTGVATGAIEKTTGREFLRSRAREPFVRTPKMALFTRYPLAPASDDPLEPEPAGQLGPASDDLLEPEPAGQLGAASDDRLEPISDGQLEPVSDSRLEPASSDSKDSATGASSELLVVNVHAINFRGKFAFQEQIEELIARLSTHSGPILLAGDFNTWSAGRVEVLERLTKEAGLASVAFEGGRRAVLGHALDHVFIRQLEVISSRVRTDIESSDHKALEVELRVIAGR